MFFTSNIKEFMQSTSLPAFSHLFFFHLKSEPFTFATRSLVRKMLSDLMSRCMNLVEDRVWCLVFGVWDLGLGFGVWGLWFGVWGLGFGVWGLGLGFGVWGLGCGVWSLDFRVQGLEFRF